MSGEMTEWNDQGMLIRIALALHCRCGTLKRISSECCRITEHDSLAALVKDLHPYTILAFPQPYIKHDHNLVPI